MDRFTGRFCFICVILQTLWTATAQWDFSTPDGLQEIKGRFRKRVVLANVPSFRFSFRGNIHRNHPFGNHPFVNTKKGSLGDKRAVSKRVVLANVPSFRFSFRGNIRQNHLFGNHPFANPRLMVCSPVKGTHSVESSFPGVPRSLPGCPRPLALVGLQKVKTSVVFFRPQSALDMLPVLELVEGLPRETDQLCKLGILIYWSLQSHFSSHISFFLKPFDAAKKIELHWCESVYICVHVQHIAVELLSGPSLAFFRVIIWSKFVFFAQNLVCRKTL